MDMEERGDARTSSWLASTSAYRNYRITLRVMADIRAIVEAFEKFPWENWSDVLDYIDVLNRSDMRLTILCLDV